MKLDRNERPVWINISSIAMIEPSIRPTQKIKIWFVNGGPAIEFDANGMNNAAIALMTSQRRFTLSNT